jgi:hypothetical protein
MADEAQRKDMMKKTAVLEIPGMDAVVVRRDVPYEAPEEGARTLDLYAPPELKEGERRPAVVFVTGYPDPGFLAAFGTKLKDMGAYTSWGRLVAASGLVGVAYANREPADLYLVLQYLRQNAAALGIDEKRIGLWACSGNVPMALSVLMHEASDAFRCAVLCYGYMLDLEQPARVAEVAAQIGFANPGAGRSVDDLPRDLPLFLVRSGQDKLPYLNESIDRFLAKALGRNLPMTLVNHAAGQHAFDLLDDTEASREIIRGILQFLRFHLLV